MELNELVEKMRGSYPAQFSNGASVAANAQYGQYHEELPQKIKNIEEGINRLLAKIGGDSVLGREVHADRYRQLARYCGAYDAMQRIGRD